MDQKKIDRINELYKKQKAGTIGMITPAENEVCVLRTVVRRTTDTAQTAESGTRAR